MKICLNKEFSYRLTIESDLPTDEQTVWTIKNPTFGDKADHSGFLLTYCKNQQLLDDNDSNVVNETHIQLYQDYEKRKYTVLANAIIGVSGLVDEDNKAVQWPDDADLRINILGALPKTVIDELYNVFVDSMSISEDSAKN